MKIPRVVAALILVAAVRADAARGPENMDFAAGATVGWRLVASDSALYGLEVRRDSVSSERCLVIARPGRARGGYGMARQMLDARPWRGRRISFDARLSYRNGANGGWANMWLSIADDKEHILRNESLNDRHFTTAAWQTASLMADVPAEADSISLGFMLIGSGSTWVSDAAFRDVGRAGEGDQPPRALGDRGLENLVAFTRLLGYVRFFDPADSAAATDWESFAIAGVDSVEAARSPAQLAATLTRMFRPLDADLRVGTSPVAIDPQAKDPKGIVVWRHH
jgi:hypothetical protein